MNMNLTDEIKKIFFNNHLKDLIEEIKNSNIEYFDQNTEVPESYYISRCGNKEVKVFVLDDFSSQLRVYWEDNNELNNEKFIESIIKLSKELFETEKESEEISEFIYQMF